jgi:hypothetical protein
MPAKKKGKGKAKKRLTKGKQKVVVVERPPTNNEGLAKSQVRKARPVQNNRAEKPQEGTVSPGGRGVTASSQNQSQLATLKEELWSGLKANQAATTAGIDELSKRVNDIITFSQNRQPTQITMPVVSDDDDDDDDLDEEVPTAAPIQREYNPLERPQKATIEPAGNKYGELEFNLKSGPDPSTEIPTKVRYTKEGKLEYAVGPGSYQPTTLDELKNKMRHNWNAAEDQIGKVETALLGRKNLASRADKWRMRNDNTGDEHTIKIYPDDRIRIKLKDEKWARDADGSKIRRDFTDAAGAAQQMRTLGYTYEDIDRALNKWAGTNSQKRNEVKNVLTNVAKKNLYTKQYDNDLHSLEKKKGWFGSRPESSNKIQALIGPDMIRASNYQGGKWQQRTFDMTGNYSDRDKAKKELTKFLGTEEEADKLLSKYDKRKQKFDTSAKVDASQPLKFHWWKSPSEAAMKERYQYLKPKEGKTQAEREEFEKITKKLEKKNPGFQTMTQQVGTPTLKGGIDNSKLVKHGFKRHETLVSEAKGNDGRKYLIGSMGTQIPVGGEKTWGETFKGVVKGGVKLAAQALDVAGAIQSPAYAAARPFIAGTMNHFFAPKEGEKPGFGYKITQAITNNPSWKHSEQMEQLARQKEIMEMNQMMRQPQIEEIQREQDKRRNFAKKEERKYKLGIETLEAQLKTGQINDAEFVDRVKEAIDGVITAGAGIAAIARPIEASIAKGLGTGVTNALAPIVKEIRAKKYERMKDLGYKKLKYKN